MYTTNFKWTEQVSLCIHVYKTKKDHNFGDRKEKIETMPLYFN